MYTIALSEDQQLAVTVLDTVMDRGVRIDIDPDGEAPLGYLSALEDGATSWARRIYRQFPHCSYRIYRDDHHVVLKFFDIARRDLEARIDLLNPEIALAIKSAQHEVAKSVGY